MSKRSKNIKGRLSRLHSSRHRPAPEGDTAPRVFVAEPEGPLDSTPPPPAPTPEPSKRRPRALASLLIREESFSGEHRHGDAPLRHERWPNRGGVVGLGELELSEIAFLDIETSGLRNSDPVICVCAGWWERSMFHVKLYALRDIDSEREMLVELSNDLSGFSGLCTFNGKSFDAPRLTHRFTLHEVDSPLVGLRHVDLVQTARKRLPRRGAKLGLQNLEQGLLGFRREHDLPGRLVPVRWREFTRTRDAALLDDIHEHNILDVVSLTALLSLFAQDQELSLSPPDASKHAPRSRRKTGKQQRVSPQPTTAPPAALTPLQKKLAKTYSLRAKSGGQRAREQRVTSSAGAPAFELPAADGASPPADLKLGARVAWLREAIEASRAQGDSLTSCAPWIMELVALAPRHTVGLRLLAGYYREVGAADCAEKIEARITKSSALY